MRNFINKHFRKSKCVKVIYFSADKKQAIYYLIPSDSTISIGGKAFMINKNDFFIDRKSFITYIFSFNRVEPIDPHNATTLGDMTPAKLGVALNSKVASEILNATRQKTDINTLIFAMMFLMLVGFAGVWYMLSTQIDDLTALIEAILP